MPSYTFEEKIKNGTGATNRSNKASVSAHAQGVEIIDIQQPRSALPVLGRNQRYRIIETDVKRASIKFQVDFDAFLADGKTITITFGENTTPMIITMNSGTGTNQTFLGDHYAYAVFGCNETVPANLNGDTLLLTDSDGRTVTFIYRDYLSGAAKATDTQYSIGVKDISTADDHAVEVVAAINLANTNGDLGISAAVDGTVSEAGFRVTQDKAGPAGNTAISGTALSQNEIAGQAAFKYGYLNGANLYVASTSGKGSSFPAAFLPLLNSIANFDAFFVPLFGEPTFVIKAQHPVDDKYDISISSNDSTVQALFDLAEIVPGKRRTRSIRERDYFEDLEGYFDGSHADGLELSVVRGSGLEDRVTKSVKFPEGRVQQTISFNLETDDYGFGKEYLDNTPFFDLGKYDAVSYVNNNGPAGMFPVVGSFASYDSNLQLNGIVEPFEIRRVALGLSLTLPDEGPISGEVTEAKSPSFFMEVAEVTKKSEFYEDAPTRGFTKSPPSITSDRSAEAATLLEAEYVSDFKELARPYTDRAIKDNNTDLDSGIFEVLISMEPLGLNHGVLPLTAIDMTTGFDSFSRDRQNSMTYRGLLRS